MIDVTTASDAELQIILHGLRKLSYWHFKESDAYTLLGLENCIKTELGERFFEKESKGFKFEHVKMQTEA